MAGRSDNILTRSYQRDFIPSQINNSYCGGVLNAIQLLDRCQSTGLAKEKTRNYRQRKPADGLNPSGWGDCILAAALNSAIALKLKAIFKKRSSGFWNLPPNPFRNRQNPFTQR
ncbi:hypothetical protein QUA41_20760 [Microcoleus sp. Pol11C1]|uniref:hypothetical protein n=1 Tax=unclassified Microcoleus TaxID=2642155 RepID=UPI002FD3F4F4